MLLPLVDEASKYDPGDLEIGPYRLMSDLEMLPAPRRRRAVMVPAVPFSFSKLGFWVCGVVFAGLGPTKGKPRGSLRGPCFARLCGVFLHRELSGSLAAHACKGVLA